MLLKADGHRRFNSMTNKSNKTGRPDADRRLRQADRLARVLRLLQLLLGRGEWNPRTLAAEQECSERTIYRDLCVLELAGVPWFFDQERGCYSLRPDFRFPVLSLTEDELLGQATAAVITSAPGLRGSDGAAAVTRKLAASASNDDAKILNDAERVVAVLDLKLADHSRHQESIRTVQWALLATRQVAGQYQSPYQEKPIKLTLHPYRLCLVKQAWYVIARSVKDDGPKTFRIPRFKSLRMLDAPAEIPDDFDLKSHFGNAWAVFRGDKTYDVAIEFTRDAAPLVTETTWHHTQRVNWHRDGRATVQFRVDGLEEIVWWVLGWSGRAKVIRPPELRELVVKQLREAMRLNDP